MTCYDNGMGYGACVISSAVRRVFTSMVNHRNGLSRQYTIFVLSGDQSRGSPQSSVASDGLLEQGKVHPRGAGTYARMLGRYVRQQRAISLIDCLRKMTIQPAQVLEHGTPSMQRKGRISAGADADIVVFDPATVTDNATFDTPATPRSDSDW